MLLIGNTGAGKSTTALTVLQQDRLRYLSDDKYLMQLEPEPRVFALFSLAKPNADVLERMPFFAR